MKLARSLTCCGLLALSLASAVAVSHAITRDQVMAIAAEYAEHQWVATAANATAECSADYVSDYSPGTYVGVAYDWGGFSSLPDYDAKLAEGYGAGSHSWHGVLSCTVGVDCSGYVSRTWGLTSKKGTATIHTVSYEIDAAELQRGDAYNKAGSHVVLWVEQDADGNPLFYEAAGPGVRLNTNATWSYLNGYVPIRYDGIEEEGAGPAPGSPANPIVIDGFPFHDERSTSSSGSFAFDAYSCAPDVGEAGPEVVYVFDLETPGVLHAELTDGPGVDVDVHLLHQPDPATCIARDHLAIGPLELAAGSYVIVMDSWSDSAGTYPGWYTLDVTFEPDAVPEPEPEPGPEPIAEAAPEPVAADPDPELAGPEEAEPASSPWLATPRVSGVVSSARDDRRTLDDGGCAGGEARPMGWLACLLLGWVALHHRRRSRPRR